MLTEVGRPLSDLIQGNNFSGLVSNIFSDAMDANSVILTSSTSQRATDAESDLKSKQPKMSAKGARAIMGVAVGMPSPVTKSPMPAWK